MSEIPKYKPPGIFAFRVWGLIFGEAYFRNFTAQLYNTQTEISVSTVCAIKTAWSQFCSGEEKVEIVGKIRE